MPLLLWLPRKSVAKLRAVLHLRCIKKIQTCAVERKRIIPRWKSGGKKWPLSTRQYAGHSPAADEIRNVKVKQNVSGNVSFPSLKPRGIFHHSDWIQSNQAAQTTPPQSLLIGFIFTSFRLMVNSPKLHSFVFSIYHHPFNLYFSSNYLIVLYHIVLVIFCKHGFSSVLR